MMKGPGENLDFHRYITLGAGAERRQGVGGKHISVYPGQQSVLVSKFPKFPAVPCLAMEQWEREGKLAERGMSGGQISFL